MRYDSPQPGTTERVNGHHVGYSFDQSPERRTHLLYFAARPVAQWREEAGGKGSGGAITFLATDHLGTPACALAGDASVTWSGGFEPFGRDWQHGTPEGALASGLFLRLPGQWDHPYWHRDLRSEGFGADLFYNVHRWYEAGTGRYVSADPLGLEAGPNLFAYGRANPVFWQDPLGLSVLQLCCRPLHGRTLRAINWVVGGQLNHCYAKEAASPFGSTLNTWSLVNDSGWAAPGKNHPEDSQYRGPEDCGPVSCSTKQATDCLDEVTRRYPIRRYPALGGITLFGPNSGPNSNTFARRLLQCGIQPPPLANEVSAPGWNWAR